MSDSDPLGVFLASSGSRGDRLLFRFPYENDEERKTTFKAVGRNPYAVHIEEDPQSFQLTVLESTEQNLKGALSEYTDKILANLLAVKQGLCGQRFEVKINNVMFVGHPVKAEYYPSQSQCGKNEVISFNVVIALHAGTDKLAVECFHDLVQQLAVALKHEEMRCGYVSAQKHIMWAMQDEVAARPEDSIESPYKLMLRKSSLAQQLKSVHEGLCNTGVVQLYINKWIQITFCLPHKVHSLHLPQEAAGFAIKPEAIHQCVEMMRPYHGMLLLVDETTLLESLPIDSSPSLTTLIRVVSPLKNMQNLAIDADVALGQVYQLVSHLVYWGKAIIIYPLAENNIYVLAPNTNTFVHSSLVEKFVEQFPGVSLHAIMSEFSLPSQLGEHRDILGLPQQQSQQVQVVVYMLQHRLLVQLHTYVYLMPPGTQRSRSQLKPASVNQQSRLASSYLQLPSVEEMPVVKRSISTASESDMGSVASDESFTPSNKSPSLEMAGESSDPTLAEDSQAQWRQQDSLLAGLTPAERQAVMNVPAASNMEDLKLFTRLCPYFDGNHHVEEIMFYENVRRSQLLTLLDKFRDVLITCQHEDPCTSCWVQRSDV